jgi:ClpP class serine protease
VSEVAKNRRMDEAKVESIAQGRVWTGLAAQENGLIDRIGGLTDAVEVAREMAKISPEAEIDVVEYAPRGLFKLDLPMPSLRAPLAGLGILAMGDFGAALAWCGSEDETSAGEEDTAWLDAYELSYLRQLVRNNGRAQYLLPADFLPTSGSTGGATGVDGEK